MNQSFPYAISIADRLCNGASVIDGERFPYSLYDAQKVRVLGDLLPHFARVDISNISRYFEESGPKRWPLTDFFCVRPPFGQMWFETSNSHLRPTLGPLPVRSAVLVTCHEGVQRHDVRGDVRWLDESEPCEAIHQLIFHVFQLYRTPQVPDGEVLQRNGTATLFIDENGKPISTCCVFPMIFDAEKVPRSRFAEAEALYRESKEMASTSIGCEVFPVMLALQFMHCKNVVLQTHEPPPKLSKARVRRGKKPLLKHHTIEIAPIKTTLQNEGGLAQNGLKKAMHLCRGHFVTYTQDKPLFGRIVGTFWKSAHVRGASEAGRVTSDFRIAAPSY